MREVVVVRMLEYQDIAEMAALCQARYAAVSRSGSVVCVCSLLQVPRRRQVQMMPCSSNRAIRG